MLFARLVITEGTAVLVTVPILPPRSGIRGTREKSLKRVSLLRSEMLEAGCDETLLRRAY